MSDESHGTRRTWLGCALLIVFVASGTFVGYLAGVFYFCRPGAGNQCGLTAVFCTAPLGAVVGGVAYAIFRRR
jgi:hypothetical protein